MKHPFEFLQRHSEYGIQPTKIAAFGQSRLERPVSPKRFSVTVQGEFIKTVEAPEAHNEISSQYMSRSLKRNQIFGSSSELLGLNAEDPEAIIARAIRRGGRRRRELIEKSGPSLSIEQVAQRLSETTKEVHSLLQARALISVKDGDGEDQIPEWQIDQGRLLQGLPEVVAALPDHGWVADLLFFEGGQFLLNGDSPKQALIDGRSAEVLRCAQLYSRQGST